MNLNNVKKVLKYTPSYSIIDINWSKYFTSPYLIIKIINKDLLDKINKIGGFNPSYSKDVVEPFLNKNFWDATIKSDYYIWLNDWIIKLKEPNKIYYNDSIIIEKKLYDFIIYAFEHINKNIFIVKEKNNMCLLFLDGIQIWAIAPLRK